MFLFKLLFLSILINLLSLDFIKSEEFNGTKSSIEEKVKSWIPLENSEVVKIYYFNIINSENYTNKINEKIIVEEVEPVVYKSYNEKTHLLNINPNESTATFQLNHNYSLDEVAMKNFDHNKRFNTFNLNFLNLFSGFNKDETKKMFDNTTMKNLIIDLGVSILIVILKKCIKLC